MQKKIVLPPPGPGRRLNLTLRQTTYDALALLASERDEPVGSTASTVLEVVAEQVLQDYLAEKYPGGLPAEHPMAETKEPCASENVFSVSPSASWSP